jgi:hypothetical protein
MDTKYSECEPQQFLGIVKEKNNLETYQEMLSEISKMTTFRNRSDYKNW